MRIEVIRKSLVAANDQAAEQNRARFDAAGIFAVNLLGGAGSGKTTLLEYVLPRLADRGLQVAVIEGDLATTRDAERIAALSVPVVQVLTEGGCHLTAILVQQAANRLPLEEIDLLIIENVGNPICPANFDLGEHARLAILSVAEGDDKPAKYPYLFKSADLVVFTKCDLLPLLDFDMDRAAGFIKALGPTKPTFRTSRRAPESFQPVGEWLVCRKNGGPVDLAAGTSVLGEIEPNFSAK